MVVGEHGKMVYMTHKGRESMYICKKVHKMKVCIWKCWCMSNTDDKGYPVRSDEIYIYIKRYMTVVWNSRQRHNIMRDCEWEC